MVFLTTRARANRAPLAEISSHPPRSPVGSDSTPFSMKQILLVGLGGSIGSIVRWLLGSAIYLRFPAIKFPLATFAVNITGCLLIGILAGLVERRGMLSEDARLFLMTGLCGGFTTFSAFANENAFLLRRGESATALIYIGGSIFAGLLAVWVGFRAIPQS
jgi:CrcB protein